MSVFLIPILSMNCAAGPTDGVQLDIYVPFGLQTGNAANSTSVPQNIPGMNVSEAMSLAEASASGWLPQYDELSEDLAASGNYTGSLADNNTTVSGMSQDIGNMSGSYGTGNWYTSPEQNWFTPDTSRISANIAAFKNSLILKFKSMIP